MRTLHLFAGAGGGMLADLILGHTPVCAVEWDAYCCEVLRERVADGWFPDCTIWQGDVRAFPAEDWAGRVDCLHAGFPCQPFSVAGKRAGTADERDMWSATLGVVRTIRPEWVFLENVPGLVSWDGGARVVDIVWSLASLGYVGRHGLLGADDVGATHRRKRWWCLAYRADIRCDGLPKVGRSVGTGEGEGRLRESAGGSYEVAHCTPDERGRDPLDHPMPGRHGDARDPLRAGRDGTVDAGDLPLFPPAPDDASGWRAVLGRWPELAPAVAYDKGKRRSGREQPRQDVERNGLQPTQRDEGEGQAPESPIRGVADGMANRVQRLKALGNGQVPLAAAAAWVMLGGSCSDGR